MNIFLDTNVILESALRREELEVTRELYEKIERQGDRMFISVGSFYSMIFVVDNFLRQLPISGCNKSWLSDVDNIQRLRFSYRK